MRLLTLISRVFVTFVISSIAWGQPGTPRPDKGTVGEPTAASFELNFDGEVRALAFDDRGRLFAGGRFTKVGETPANNVAVWDGEKWSAVGEIPGISPDARSVVRGLWISDDGLLVAFVDRQRADQFHKWDGRAWDRYADDPSSAVSRSLLHPKHGLIIASRQGPRSDDPAVSKWDGKAWVGLDSAAPRDGIAKIHRVLALCAIPNGDLGLVAQFATVGSARKKGDTVHDYPVVTGLLAWDGKRWRILGPSKPDDGIWVKNGDLEMWPAGTSLAFSDDQNAFFAGHFERIGKMKLSSIAAWDGSSWSAIPEIPRFAGGRLSGGLANTPALLLLPQRRVVVAGSFYRDGSAVPTEKTNTSSRRACITLWNGSGWDIIDTSMAISGIEMDEVNRKDQDRMVLPIATAMAIDPDGRSIVAVFGAELGSIGSKPSEISWSRICRIPIGDAGRGGNEAQTPKKKSGNQAPSNKK